MPKHPITVEETIFLMLRIVMLIALGTAFFVVTSKAIQSYSDVGFAEANLLSARFLYNSNCLMKAGKIGDNYYSENIIDLSKFNQDNLERCNDKKGFSAELILEYGDAKQTIVVNEVGYILDSKACYDTERFSCVTNRYYALIDNNGKIDYGYLTIKGVLRKNV